MKIPSDLQIKDLIWSIGNFRVNVSNADRLYWHGLCIGDIWSNAKTKKQLYKAHWNYNNRIGYQITSILDWEFLHDPIERDDSSRNLQEQHIFNLQSSMFGERIIFNLNN